MSHDQDDEFESAVANYRAVIEATKIEFADTIKMLAEAIEKRATEDEVEEIQEALDDRHADLKNNLPGELDFEEHDLAWTEWVTDEISNKDYETQLASAIAGDGVEDIRELVLTRIAADRLPAL